MAKLLRNFALEVYFSRWEFSAKYHLTASDAESLSMDALLALAAPEDRERFSTLWLGYTETWGAPTLRSEFAATFDAIRPEEVLTFAGAQEALYVAMHALLQPDDHAIVLTPNYQSAETVPLSICATTGVPLDAANNWSLHLGDVSDAIRSNTKLISINFPNNPTGRILPREQFNELVHVCRKHNLWLFSDEVYRLIERHAELRLPQAADAYEKGISLNVMSKAYGLPGLRSGWLACRDRDYLQRCERFKHYLSICNSGPSEALAGIALRAREHILHRNRALVAANLAALEEFFRDFSGVFDWVVPDGGCVGFPRYRGPEGVETFTTRLVEEVGVLLLPASIYRSDLTPVPQDRFRIGYGRTNLRAGLAAMRLAGAAAPMRYGDFGLDGLGRDKSLGNTDRHH